MMNSGNLFSRIPSDLPEEAFELLAEGSGRIRIERIISRGHASPEDHWYDQESTEWVALLAGAATLEFEGEEERDLQTGDWIEIPPHRRHRVKRTSHREDTIWLAIHFQ